VVRCPERYDRRVMLTDPPPPICSHLDQAGNVHPQSDGCEECLAIGGEWVHLRLCLTCGHVGCCNDSPNRHALAHFQAAGHAIIRSFEPGEDWAWCWIDKIDVEV
jgi:hypothetical protein